MGRPVGRRGLGAILYRAHPSRSLSLGRRPRREVGGPESPGGQFRAALDSRRAQRAGPDDAPHRQLPQEGWRDRSRDGDHVAEDGGWPRDGAGRPQYQDRGAGDRQEQGGRRGDRRLQLEPRHGARVQSRSQKRQGARRIGARLDRKRTHAHSPGGRLSHAHGPHLVLCLRHARLPRSGAAARPRVPPGAGLHLGQPAGPPISQRGAVGRQFREPRAAWRRTRATPGRSWTRR